MMFELLGRPPRRLTQEGSRARQLFTRSGELRHIAASELRAWGLCEVLASKYRFDPQDAAALAGFIEPMLALDPDKRATAAQQLHAPWLRAMAPLPSASTRRAAPLPAAPSPPRSPPPQSPPLLARAGPEPTAATSAGVSVLARHAEDPEAHAHPPPSQTTHCTPAGTATSQTTGARDSGGRVDAGCYGTLHVAHALAPRPLGRESSIRSLASSTSPLPRRPDGGGAAAGARGDNEHESGDRGSPVLRPTAASRAPSFLALAGLGGGAASGLPSPLVAGGASLTAHRFAQRAPLHAAVPELAAGSLAHASGPHGCAHETSPLRRRSRDLPFSQSTGSATPVPPGAASGDVRAAAPCWAMQSSGCALSAQLGASLGAHSTAARTLCGGFVPLSGSSVRRSSEDGADVTRRAPLLPLGGDSFDDVLETARLVRDETADLDGP